MFKTKNLVHDIKEVPVPFIFEHFCKLPEKLSGQDVKIKSLFNSKERTASMCIYFDEKRSAYRYKDFSTGKGGSGIDLVKDSTGLSYHKSCELIVEKYNDYVLHNNGGYDIQDFKQQSRYKVTSVVYRSWTTKDQYFWTQFNIGSKILDQYNVRPLAYYTMNNDEKELTISGNYIYAYQKADGTVYKIYQPKTLDKKFLKVNAFIQGSEQLSGHKHLLITSSLKDIMAIKTLKLQIDIIAPDSENSIIKADQMKEYEEKYEKIVVMFDNDEAGIKAMERYKQLYPFVKVCVLAMSKDPSDSIKDFGPKAVWNQLVPLLNKKISEI